jgi:hypothetical protein
MFPGGYSIWLTISGLAGISLGIISRRQYSRLNSLKSKQGTTKFYREVKETQKHGKYLKVKNFEEELKTE